MHVYKQKQAARWNSKMPFVWTGI